MERKLDDFEIEGGIIVDKVGRCTHPTVEVYLH
jgi:hypothetical protein